MKEKFTVTAALPYANGPIHLGHIAGVYLPADIFVRFLRMNGDDVLFVCGSDEHGAAITLRAKKFNWPSHFDFCDGFIFPTKRSARVPFIIHFFGKIKFW